MNKKNDNKELIHSILKSNSFAVLATENDGQPHASLVAITPFESDNQLIFATYRDTRKFRNLSHNSKVALLIENHKVSVQNTQTSIVLTIIGHAKEISMTDYNAAYKVHLTRHPEMESFLLTSDCVLILVIAQSYQIVIGIDDIRWINAEDLDSV